MLTITLVVTGYYPKELFFVPYDDGIVFHLGIWPWPLFTEAWSLQKSYPRIQNIIYSHIPVVSGQWHYVLYRRNPANQ